MITASASPSARAHALLLLAATCLLFPACHVADPDEDLVGYTDSCVVSSHCADGFTCSGGRCSIQAGEACREGFVSVVCEGKTKGVCEGVRHPCVNGEYAKTCEDRDFGPDYEKDETRCDGLDNDCDGTVDRGPCERTFGVCAGKVHACANGLVEHTCGAATYGPDFEFDETRCDGLDNDCDGAPDMARARYLPLYGFFSPPAGSTTGGATPITSVRTEPTVVPFGRGFLGVNVSITTVSYNTQPPTPPRSRTVLSYQVMDASLVPVGPTLQFQDSERTLQGLQVVPFEGGAFVLWSSWQNSTEGGQTLSSSEVRVARLDVLPGSGQAQLTIAPRLAPTPAFASVVRAAVSQDSQQLLLTWNAGNVRGRLYSRDLEPLSEELVLSAPHPDDAPNTYVAQFDVDAHGSSGFAVGWALVPPYPAPGENNGVAPFQLRFQRLSSTLQQVGAPVALTGERGYLNDLRVLGSRNAEDNLFAAWQVSYFSQAGSPPQRPTLRHARPFAAGLPVSELVEIISTTGRLALARDAEDDVLLVRTRPDSTSTTAVTAVRRIRAGASDVERSLELPPLTFVQGASLLPHREPGMRTVAFSIPGGMAQSVSFCRF